MQFKQVGHSVVVFGAMNIRIGTLALNILSMAGLSIPFYVLLGRLTDYLG